MNTVKLFFLLLFIVTIILIILGYFLIVGYIAYKLLFWLSGNYLFSKIGAIVLTLGVIKTGYQK